MSPVLLSLLQRGLNRALALDPELSGVLGPVHGTRIAVEVLGAAPIRVLVTLTRDGVTLAPGPEPGGAPAADAHVAVSGSPAALLALLSGADEQLPLGAGVSVRGDIGALQRVSRAARRLRPDWEEAIARVFGDEAGQPLSRGLRQTGAALAHVLGELRADSAEYLREESGLLANAAQVDAFTAAVDDLRDAVERLEKRVDRIARAAAARP